MSVKQQSVVRSIVLTNRMYAEIDEYLEKELMEAGYGGMELQKSPVGVTIKVYVARPGLAIGRRGTGIKDITDRLASKFNVQNVQIAVAEIEKPELNPRVMASRIVQIVQRGTPFRRAVSWALNTIMAAGAMGAEITINGKLRSDRAHGEKYRAGIVPKSGDTAARAVREATKDVLLKLGLYGVKVKIALKDTVPPEFIVKEETKDAKPESK
jgi:small subunit ribosomal protein S3